MKFTINWNWKHFRNQKWFFICFHQNLKVFFPSIHWMFLKVDLWLIKFLTFCIHRQKVPDLIICKFYESSFLLHLRTLECIKFLINNFSLSAVGLSNIKKSSSSVSPFVSWGDFTCRLDPDPSARMSLLRAKVYQGKVCNKNYRKRRWRWMNLRDPHLFKGCIDSPAIAVTVSDSSCSLFNARTAEKPTVCASCLTHGQWVIWMAIVFWSVSIADWHGGRESSTSLIGAGSSPSKARTHSWTESQIAGRS